MTNIIRVEGKWFPMLYAGLIQTGLLSCLFLAIRLHYSQVVQTHCGNWEFWPSVSSCTGDFMPERVVWRCAIALGGGPRIIAALLQFYQFHSLLPSGRSWDINIGLVCDCIRIFSAGIWTYVASSEHLLIHEVAFVVYLVSGFLCQSLQTLVAYRIHKAHPGKQNFQKAYRSKLLLYVLQIVFAIGVGVLFHRHRTYCLPGGYSLANMSEWAFSTCNVLYDYKGYLDLEGLTFTIALKGSDTTEGEVTAGQRRYSFLSLPALSKIFPFTNTHRIFKGYLFWMYVTWLPLQVYFLPMVKMGFTVHPIMFLLPTVLITWLVGGTKTRLYFQSREGDDKFFLLSLLGLLSFDIKQWPEAKLCAISIAAAIMQVIVLSQLCNSDSRERYLTFSGLLTALPIFVIIRMANLSLDPSMTSPHGNTLIFFFGLVIYFAMKWSKSPTPESQKPISETCQPTQSKSEGHLEGLTFGFLFSLTHMLCTEHGIPSRWVGLDPYPLGVIPIVTFMIGIAVSVYVSQKPSINILKYYKYRAVVGIAAASVAVWGSSASVRMQETYPNSGIWPIDYPSWHSAGYYGSNTLSFIGAGVILPAYCGSHWIPVVEAAVMGLSNSSVSGHLRASLATFSLVYVIFIILTVYVVTFTFVPGGMLLRDRVWLLIVGLIAFMEISWFKSDKSAVHSHSSETPGRYQFISSLKKGLYLSLMLLLIVAGNRSIEQYGIEAELQNYESDTLKTSIWTIHYGYDNNGNDNYDDIVTQLLKQNSSIIGLLETDITRIATANRDLVEYAGTLLRMHTDYGSPTLDDTFGCALLSKFPIINTTRYVMPSPQGELACLIHAKILVKKKTINVYVGHFGNTEHVLDRRLQSETLGNLTLRNPEPSVFLGYLTTRPNSENYNLITSSGWSDTGAVIGEVPYTHPEPKKWVFPNGKIMNQDPKSPDVFGGRYCQYVLFKNLTMQWWGKTDAGHISDTEIQTAWFDLP